MWRELIESLISEYTFYPPADPALIAAIEAALGMTLPDDLKSLLAESNGVDGKYGLGLIWPAERIKADNQMFRSYPDFAELYMPFDHLVFFADAGNGDHFAFAVRKNGTVDGDVFVWNHEDDSRIHVAFSLRQYLERSCRGEISF